MKTALYPIIRKVPFVLITLLGSAILLLAGCSGKAKEERTEEGDRDTAKVVSDPGKDPGTSSAPMDRTDRKRAVVPTPRTLREKLPGKKTYNSVEKRKMAFFEYLYPVVHAENRSILEEKEFLRRAHSYYASDDSLADSTITRLKALGIKYRVDPQRLPSKKGFEELERKVDIIPEELALIQAANESNWGRSRFAKQGNNLFGQWCFSKGCGIVPKRRSEGSSHEVAAFPNVRFSVRSYLRNLNSHPAYKPLREIRARMRKKGKEPSGYAMAGGLNKYAGIGHDYVKILRRMMKTNKELLEKAGPVPPIFSEKAKEVELEGGSS